MSVLLIGRTCVYRKTVQCCSPLEEILTGEFPVYRTGRRHLLPYRQFSSSRCWQGESRGQAGEDGKESFHSRLKLAWRKTKVECYPIPVGLGIAFLGFAQFLKSQRAETARQQREAASRYGYEDVSVGTSKRPSGPW